MQLIIDRFEGDYAVCEKENREMIDIERTKLPPNAKEGDVLILAEDGSIAIDRGETARRREMIEQLMDELWED
ncbi:MAG: DUF3006 domain-containing protein [Clostridia bacterium]|jgi:hypothetical protein